MPNIVKYCLNNVLTTKAVSILLLIFKKCVRCDFSFMTTKKGLKVTKVKLERKGQGRQFWLAIVAIDLSQCRLRQPTMMIIWCTFVLSI